MELNIIKNFVSLHVPQKKMKGGKIIMQIDLLELNQDLFVKDVPHIN